MNQTDYGIQPGDMRTAAVRDVEPGMIRHASTRITEQLDRLDGAIEGLAHALAPVCVDRNDATPVDTDEVRPVMSATATDMHNQAARLSDAVDRIHALRRALDI